MKNKYSTKFWLLQVSIIISTLAYIFAPSGVFAEKVSDLKPTGFVNDFASVLTKEQKTDLENSLIAYEKSSTNEVSVVTIKTLDGDTVENFTNELFNKWKVGKSKSTVKKGGNTDNGVMILVAMQEHKIRIEVGYGLEGVLTDAQSKAIIDKIISPNFKQGQYFIGLTAGCNTVMSTISGTFIPTNIPDSTSQSDSIPNSGSSSGGNGIGTLIVLGLYLGLFFISITIKVLVNHKSLWYGAGLGFIWYLLLSFLAGYISFGILGLNTFILLGICVVSGVLFDFLISAFYKTKIGKKIIGSKSVRGMFIGGRGGGGFGGGGFGGGGFGGGGSGGGGASGGW